MMTKLDQDAQFFVTREEFEAGISRLSAAFTELAAIVAEIKNAPTGDDEEGTPWPDGLVRLKVAAFRTGYSQSGIRSMVDRKIVLRRTKGGKVYVKLADIPQRKCEKA